MILIVKRIAYRIYDSRFFTCSMVQISQISRLFHAKSSSLIEGENENSLHSNGWQCEGDDISVGAWAFLRAHWTKNTFLMRNMLAKVALDYLIILQHSQPMPLFIHLRTLACTWRIVFAMLASIQCAQRIAYNVDGRCQNKRYIIYFHIKQDEMCIAVTFYVQCWYSCFWSTTAFFIAVNQKSVALHHVPKNLYTTLLHNPNREQSVHIFWLLCFRCWFLLRYFVFFFFLTSFWLR